MKIAIIIVATIIFSVIGLVGGRFVYNFSRPNRVNPPEFSTETSEDGSYDPMKSLAEAQKRAGDSQRMFNDRMDWQLMGAILMGLIGAGGSLAFVMISGKGQPKKKSRKK